MQAAQNRLHARKAAYSEEIQTHTVSLQQCLHNSARLLIAVAPAASKTRRLRQTQMISLQSMKRPPSPLQPERESSWRDFREAASERRKRARRRRLDVAFLAVGCAAAELPAGAAPALLPALAACGATFDGLCLVGVAHHVGVAVAAAVRRFRFSLSINTVLRAPV